MEWHWKKLIAVSVNIWTSGHLHDNKMEKLYNVLFDVDHHTFSWKLTIRFCQILIEHVPYSFQ